MVSSTMYYIWNGVQMLVQDVLNDLLDQADEARNKTHYFDLAQIRVMQRTMEQLRASVRRVPHDAEFERFRSYLLSLIDDYDGAIVSIHRDQFAGVVSGMASTFESYQLLKVERQRLKQLMDSGA